MNSSVPKTHGYGALVIYGLASGFLGLFLAFLTRRVLLPGAGTILRPAIDVLGCFVVMLVSWFKIPLNRPHPGALVLRVLMVWSFAIISLVMYRRSILQGQFTSVELFILGSAVTVLLLGVIFTFRASWGKQWLLLR